MKLITYSILFLVFCTYGFPQKQTKENLLKNKHVFYNGTLVTIYIDKMLYLSKEESFLIKVTIENKTKSDLAVDLNNYWKVIYPNQCGKLTKPIREEINERNIIPDTLNQEKKESLKKSFAENKLRIIPAGKQTEYYRNFNGGKKENMLLSKGEYLYISFDGQLFITNGKDLFEHIYVINNKKVQSEMFLEYPINWGNISNKNAIIKKL